MKSPHPKLGLVLGFLALGVLVAPRTVNADEPKGETPPAAKESGDADPKPGPEAKPRAAADDPTKNMSEKELKKAIKKYDANGNGVLDPDELAKLKADQNARRNTNGADKADLRSTQRINHSIRQSTKGSRVVK